VACPQEFEALVTVRHEQDLIALLAPGATMSIGASLRFVLVSVKDVRVWGGAR
jgi:hypothetical protein